jgi:hypothetical protein
LGLCSLLLDLVIGPHGSLTSTLRGSKESTFPNKQRNNRQSDRFSAVRMPERAVAIHKLKSRTVTKLSSGDAQKVWRGFC